MTWIYNVFIRLYVSAIRIASVRNKKAAEWVKGREGLFEELKHLVSTGDKTIWFHCASAGELEQGKPLIEALKLEYPNHKMVISFFSPSGFQAGKKYLYADVVTYLPADTKANAKRFVDIVHPELVVFVKYEFWFHHLSALAFHHVPVILVSSIFRRNQEFFKWYGKFYRQILFLFRQLFVQDEASFQLLKEHQIQHATVSGDTRFDRVVKIAGQQEPLESIDRFAGRKKIIVAGSTWPDDEKLLAQYLHPGVKIIMAPHEINSSHLDFIKSIFTGAVLYSDLHNEGSENAEVLIIDNVGMLSRLYSSATITYIGGGFNKSGIHNTLEAAVYGKPVLFGPNYRKFREARDLITAGGASSISNAAELKTKMDQLLTDPGYLFKCGRASKEYVMKNTGATQTVMNYIQAKRLLTR